MLLNILPLDLYLNLSCHLLILRSVKETTFGRRFYQSYWQKHGETTSWFRPLESKISPMLLTTPRCRAMAVYRRYSIRYRKPRGVSQLRVVGVCVIEQTSRRGLEKSRSRRAFWRRMILWWQRDSRKYISCTEKSCEWCLIDATNMHGNVHSAVRRS